jgi:multiple sugar transport system substrate-binding protein
MYARRSVLEDNGIRIPTLDDPWTLDEFDAALETLQATGDYEYAFDPGMAWTGEWYPYAFSPMLQSFGGDIIDRTTFTTAEGALNGDEAIAFGEWWQSLFDRGLAPGTSQDGADRETGFVDGKYALQWNGNWGAIPPLEAFGDDMLFLPAPDFGHGPKIGAGSWQFGVSADSEHKDGANAFITFALQDEYLAAFSDGIGLIPSTPSAAALTEKYAPGGPLEVFFELSNEQALIRPPTPAYLSAALTFEKALADIANGADVVNALDAAVDEIDADIEANNGYGFTGEVVNPVEEEAAVEPAVEATALSMWYHGAGNSTESDIVHQIIDDFNASQSEYVIELEDFPQATYNESVVAAALAGDLPDIIDMDGPVMPNWAWAGYLSPLDLSEGTLDDFLPGTIGMWDGEVYSVGLWDAAIAMYARRSVLEDNGIRIPTLDDPWTLEEFDAALETLQATGDYEYAFDPGMAWTGEWYPYAFSPMLQSFGGDIIDRDTYLTAEGVLNGDEAIAFGEWWQSLFERGLAPGTSQDGADRETGFVDGKYALQWNGNWGAMPPLEAFGDDMLFLPAPDFGHGPKIGAASWQFGVSADSEHKDGANAFIEFALQDKYLAAFSDGIGLIPSTPSAAALTESYAPGGPLEVFFALSNEQAMIRPPTPAYLSAALTFEKAMADIANGADVINALDAAVDEIDADIEANNGYGFGE